MKNKPAHVSAELLYNIKLITDFDLSPCGAWVVFALQSNKRKANAKKTQLWLVSTASGKPVRLTHDKASNSQPRWSPCGGRIAFLSDFGDEKRSQIWLARLPKSGKGDDGGLAALPPKRKCIKFRQVTKLSGQIGEIAWSPCGKRIAHTYRQADKPNEKTKNKKGKADGKTALHFDRMFYKLDGVGYLPQNRWGISVLNVKSGKSRCLTDGTHFDDRNPAWSPDGERLVFVSNRHPHPDLEIDGDDLWLVGRKGGKPQKVESFVGRKSKPVFSPDGGRLAFFGKNAQGEWWRNTALFRLELGGKGRFKNLLEKHDIDAECSTLNDLAGLPPELPPIWSGDGERLYFPVSKHGRTEIWQAKAAGGGVSAVFEGRCAIGKFVFDKSQGKLLAFQSSMTNPGRLVSKDMETGNIAVVCDPNAKLLQSVAFSTPEEVWFKGSDGNGLQGWIMKPPSFDGGRKYPSILEIHGGPLMQYGESLMHEFQFLAAKGYVVCFCNPRGGKGYGEEHAEAIQNDWGGKDYEDLMAFADLVAAQPYIDEKRMGVTGGSYGGYMTNWIIGHTDRFKAAVTQRCVSNLVSMWGTSDFNWVFQQVFGNKPVYDDFENLWRMSPLKYLGNALTPTLVLHSERDFRCALEQGEQVYAALRYQGIPSELVIFPDESHGLSRGGRMDRRIARLNHILRWFDGFL